MDVDAAASIDVDAAAGTNVSRRVKTAREIAKIQNSIRKKYREDREKYRKTGEIEEQIALERRLKPIVQPLKRIVENTARDESTEEIDPIAFVGAKRKRETDDDDEPPSRPTKRRLSTRSPTIATASPATRNESEELTSNAQWGPLGCKYMGALLRGQTEQVYGVYFDLSGSMLGDRRFDVAADDSVIVGNTQYPGTPGLRIDLQETSRRRVHGERQANVQEYTVDYKRPSAWPQRAYTHSRKQMFQVQAYHRAAIAR
ncbi:hypothetical protein P5V15_010202 [Pogonomyrmex californicus]